MNEHLQPVFEVLLPQLERQGIEYWVYGGVGIAGVAGEFFRNNADVDIFVEEADYENAIQALDDACRQNDVCKRNGFVVKRCRPLRNERPKCEVKATKKTDKGTKEVLSVVPVYRKDGLVEFRFGSGKLARYCGDILDRIPRNICGYSFFSPPDAYIRELFKTYLKNRPGKRKCEKVRKDAQKILTVEECRALRIPEPTG
jgi:hypothetical protein